MLNIACLALAAVGTHAASTTPKKEVTYDIGLKTLLLYNWSSDQTVARVVMNGYDTDFDIRKTIPDLSTPIYNSIVVADSEVNDGNFAPLRAYAEKYNVRIVFLYSPLTADLSVKKIASPDTTNVVFDNSTYGMQLADVMNTKSAWDVSLPALATMPVEIIDGADTISVPFMRFTNGTSITNEGPVAAFVSTYPSGRQEMHFTFRAWANELCAECELPIKDEPNFVTEGHYTKLNLALGNVWFQWVTKGVYLGARRMFLEPEVDDWFIRSEVFGNNYMFRLNGTDVEQAAFFVRNITKKLDMAPGSFIKFEPGFNGAGHNNWGLQQDLHEGHDLNQYTQTYLSDFHWLSHTWSHQNLDWLNYNQCPTQLPNSCRTPVQRVDAEIHCNRMFARGDAINATEYDPKGLSGGALTPGGNMFYNNTPLYNSHFSEDCLVTPDISALYPRNYNMSWWNHFGEIPVRGNFETMRALYKNGIRSIVGDNSRRELMSPVNAHHAIMTTDAEYGVTGIAIIPRNDINIAYNTNNATTFLYWYNKVRACGWSVGIKCEDRDYTFEEAMARQTSLTAYSRLAFKADPFMFHQCNVGTFRMDDGTHHSLISYWTEHSLMDILYYVNKMPITSPRLHDTTQFFLRRMDRDASNITATLSFVNGVAKAIKVTSLKNTTALISIQNTMVKDMFPQDKNITMEIYGNDNTYEIVLEGNNTTKTIAIGAQL